MVTDASTDPALDAAIRAIPSWEGTELEIVPIAEGRTNRNFHVTAGDDAFFLRLSEKSTELLGSTGPRSRTPSGRRPRPVSGLRCSCTSRSWDASSPGGSTPTPCPRVTSSAKRCSRPVVAAIKAIHAGPPLPSSFDPFRIVEEYRRISEERGVVVPDAFDGAHEKASRIEAAFASDPMPLPPCHNDLLEANFLLRDGHVWVVDHEYAGMGDPFFDLGNLSINNALSDDAQERLLALYFDTPTDAHRARLKLMRIMSDFREAMWGVVQQGLSTLDIDYVEYATKHFDRLSTTMADPRFDDWLEASRRN